MRPSSHKPSKPRSRNPLKARGKNNRGGRRATLESLEARRLMAVVEHFGNITADQTWAGGDVHLLTGNVTVKPGATLTVQPGAVVKSQSFFISLFVEGTLNAQGTAANGNIVFTSPRDDTAGGDTNGDGGATTPGPSDWGGVVITPAGVAAIDHAQFRFGAGGMLTSQGGMTLQNSTLRNSGGFAALRIENSDPTMTNVTFQNNAGAAVSMDLNSNPAIQNVSLTGNGTNGLVLDGGSLGEDGFWDDPTIPYVMNANITVPAGRKLTVGAGQVVKNNNFFATLQINGALEARGVAGEPVIFTSLRDDTAGGDANNDGAATAPAPNDWGDIVLSGPGSVMEQVEVRYGAAQQLTISGGALTLSDGVFRDSGGAPVRIENSDPTLTRVTFANNRSGAAVSMDLNSNPTIQDVTLTNNQTNGLLLDGGSLVKDLTWDDPEIPYVMNANITVPAGRKLTLGAGQVVKNGNFFASLLVNGALEARGEPGAPVVFTSLRDDTTGGDANNDGNATAPAASDWGRIVLSGPGSVMEQVEVRYGAANALTISGGGLTLSNGLFRNTGGVALRIENSDPALTNVTFTDNAGAAVSMDLNSNPTIRGVTVSGNATNGLELDGGVLGKDLAWDDPDITYVMNANITVPADRKLTMSAGQVLKNGNFFSRLLVNGTLEARGAAGAPVIFTSLWDDAAGGDANNDGNATTPAPNDWGAIVLSGPGNVMDQVEVRYGVNNQLTVAGGALTLTGSVLRNSGGAALRIESSDPTVTNVTFAGNLSGPAVSMDLSSNPTIQDVMLTNNQTNGLILDSGTLGKDLVWDDSDIPYVMVGTITVPAGRKLTVSGGQVVKNNNFFATLTVDGTLEARGTAGAPVVFTSLRDDTAIGDTNNDGDDTTAEPNNWGGIVVRSAGNVLEQVEVRYGAGGQVTVDGGALTLASSVVRNAGNMGVLVQNNGTLTATNNLIYANLGDGVQAVSGATANLTNNTIDGNFRGVNVGQATATLVNNLITFHTEAGVRSAGGTVNASFNTVHNPTAARGNYDGLPDPTGQNGNLAIDPKYFNRTNRQYQLRGGSRAIDSGTSDGAPATDRLGNPRFDDPNVLNAGAGAQPFFDRGAFERQQVSISNVDLATTAVSGPALGLAEQQVTVNWTVRNLGSETALGPWQDAVYLSPDRIWTPDDILLGQAARAEDLGPGQSYDGSAQVLLPAVLPGDYFFLVRANSQQDVFEGVALVNNVATSAETVAMDMPLLGFGAPTAGQLDARGDFTYYRISTPAGADLNLELTGAANAVNELYVDFGQLPTRQQFQARGNQPGTANQTVSVNNTREGAYYVLVFGAQMTAAQSFTITASLEGFGIQSVTPAQGSNLGDVTILVRGARFTDQTLVRLVDAGGAVVNPRTTHFTDSGLISATFDLRGRPLGFADVQVTNPGDMTLTLPDGFTIAAGEPGRLVTAIKAPSGVRLGRNFELIVEYSNAGDTDLPAPIMQLQGQGLSDLGFTREALEANAPLTLVGINPQGPAGVLPPGASGKLTIFGKAKTNGNEQFQLAVEERMSGPIDWPSLGPSLRPVGISDADWDALFAEIQAVIGADWSGYRAAIARAATLLPPNRGLSHRLSDVFQIVIDEAIARQSTSVRGDLRRADTGAPLPNAPIRFATATSDASYDIVSNQDGSFLLPRAVPGVYEVTVEGFYSETPLQVTIGASDLEDVEFAVSPGNPLSGRVVRAANGAAVREALVRAVSDQGRGFFARTDSNGEYEFASLPSGQFDIYVASDTFLPAMLVNVNLAEHEARRDVNIALADAAVMRGVITGPNGPVEGAAITAVTNEGEVFSTLSDEMGQYRLLTAPGKQYTVTAETEDLFAPPRTNVFASAVNVNFQLAAGGAVSGKATLPGGAPAALEELRLQGPGGAIVSSTDESGDFSETGLPPGQYTITVDLGDHMAFTSAPFTVTAGATTTFNIQLAPAGVVSGVVRDQAGGPVRKVVVHALGADGLVAVTVTDDQGQYTLSGFEAGTYTIVVGDEFSPGLARQTVTLDAAQTSRQADFTVNVAGLVAGRVLERDGQTPIANAVVRLVQQGKELLRMETDAAGQYAFVIVEPGVYQLEAEALGSAFSTLKNISVTGGAMTGLDLIEGNQTISGVVRAAADGAPIAGATVTVHRLDPDLADTEISFVVTNPDGIFAFTRATAGDYRLIVQAAGFAAGIQTAPAGATGLQFALAPESILQGTVRDLATGQAIESAMISLSSDAGGPIHSFAFTDAAGAYSFPGLPPGSYQLIVRTTSHETRVAANVNVAGTITTQNIALAAASTSVSGVVQSGGIPLNEATVYAEDAQGRILASATTDAAGAFTLATLPPGTHQLFALAQGYRQSNAVEVTLSDGQDVENVNLAIAPAALSDIEVPANPDVVNFHFDIKKTPARLHELTPEEQAILDDAGGCLQSLFFFDRKSDMDRAYSALAAQHAALKSLVENSNAQAVERQRSLNALQNTLRLFDKAAEKLIASSAIDDLLSGLEFDFDPFGIIKGVAREFLKSVVSYKDDINKINQLHANLTSEQNKETDFAAGATAGEELNKALDELRDKLVFINAAARTSLGLPPVNPAPAFNDIQEKLLKEIGKRAAKSEDGQLAVELIGPDVVTNFIDLPIDRLDRFQRQIKVRINVQEKLAEYAENLRAYRSNVKTLKYSLNNLKSCGCKPATPTPIPGLGEGELSMSFSSCTIDPPPGQQLVVAAQANTRIATSFDPNDKIGPAGFGADGFIKPGVMPFTILFENDPALGATIPAQEVFVTDVLDEDLDLSTLEFTAFGFNNFEFDVPPGLSRYETTIDLRPEGINLLVPVLLEVNPDTRELKATFRSLDPLTGLLPDELDAGFLPVNDKMLHNGEGFFSYRVQPRADRSTGTVILNQGSIVFDVNAPILTPQTRHTLDEVAPTSQVNALPAVVSTPNFTVTWSGQDDAGGSGVANYDVFVSVDGGPFSLWLAGTAETSAVYPGEVDRNYRFYTVARDNVGWQEAAPTGFDAEAEVTIGVWQNPANRFDATGNGSVGLEDLLAIVTHLRTFGNPHTLPPAPTAEISTPPFVDIDNNQRVDLADLLAVVQQLRAQIEGAGEEEPAPEGEAVALDASTSLEASDGFFSGLANDDEDDDSLFEEDWLEDLDNALRSVQRRPPRRD